MITKIRGKLIITTVITGAVSLLIYILVFAYQDVIMRYCTMGGVFSALPLAIALFVSVTYGIFAHALLSMAGLEAKINGDKPFQEE